MSAPEMATKPRTETCSDQTHNTDLVNQDASPFDEIMDQSGVRMIDGLEHELRLGTVHDMEIPVTEDIDPLRMPVGIAVGLVLPHRAHLVLIFQITTSPFVHMSSLATHTNTSSESVVAILTPPFPAPFPGVPDLPKQLPS